MDTQVADVAGKALRPGQIVAFSFAPKGNNALTVGHVVRVTKKGAVVQCLKQWPGGLRQHEMFRKSGALAVVQEVC